MKAKDRVTDGGNSPARRFAIALGGLLLSAAVGLAQVLPVESGTKVLIADVIPQGLHNVPTQRVMDMIKTRPGGEYKRSVVEEDVRHLYETHLFANIRIWEQTNPDGKLVVYFQFQEFPNRIQDIIYQGAKHMDKDELSNLTGLRKGDPLNTAINQQAVQKILQHYYEKGRMLASVDLVEGGQPGDSRVVFNITEGKVAKVSGIDFSGNEFVTKGRLRTQVNSSSQFLWVLGGTFNPAMADNDVLKLAEYYRSFGYHDVRVSRELQWDADQRHVHLVFHLQEGERYKVGGVDVAGYSTAPALELVALTKLEKGEFIDENKVKGDINRIKDYYGYRGSDAAVVETVVYSPDKPEANIEYTVQEHPPATVGEIKIVGNTVTRQNVILRQIPVYPGQVLSYPDLRLAERNLAKLNIFESNPEQGVRPTVSVIDDNPDNPVKDIRVDVQETSTGSLLFGVGVNSDAGLTGSIVLNERNFDITRPPTSIDDLLSGQAWRGGGQEFRVEAVPGTQIQRYDVNFREPYLFDTPYSLSVGGYYYERIYNEDTESRVGTRVTVGRKLNDLWSASVGMRVEDVGIHNVPAYAPPDYLNVVGDNFLVGFRAGLTRDSRDSYLRATEGSLLDFSFEEVTGEFTFPVFNVEANKYFTVYQRPDQSGRQVLAYHGQLSLTTSNAPVYERFYAGGFQSMRGFEFRGVGPDINGFKVGGDFMFLNSLEYQIPILANDQMYFVGFVDSGTVDNSISLSNYRVSAGVGMRIVVPMLGPVPIALDFGFPIVKADTDKTQVFSFWVGFFH